MQLQNIFWVEDKYISHHQLKKIMPRKSNWTLIEIYSQKTVLLEVYGITAKQGLEILLQTVIFICVKQMEKYWGRVNWLVQTEKNLCICWEARHISILPTRESRRDVLPVEIMRFSLGVK